ncbi:hypothetical protein [uncultured Pseudoalteromonas sp.]|uniref:hypothetical protein n=1 Tax=uncultured Pseudoalteromonas sp. TaxID=114053 RepID=UPI00259A11F3|nr:hypothetical protein [uncultured Pseudoalteromonas sp.]
MDTIHTRERHYLEYEPSSGLVGYISSEHANAIVTVEKENKAHWEQWLAQVGRGNSLEIRVGEGELFERDPSLVVVTECIEGSLHIREIECRLSTPCADPTLYTHIKRLKRRGLSDRVSEVEVLKVGGQAWIIIPSH